MLGTLAAALHRGHHAAAAAAALTVAAPFLRPPARRFVQVVRDTFCCEVSGWCHVCDSECGEMVVDAATEMLTCPISGRMAERLMAEDEVAAASRGGVLDDPGLEHEYGGHLARAYVAGYECRTEDELARVCGVPRFSR